MLQRYDPVGSQIHEAKVPLSVIISNLKLCGNRKDLEQGKRWHSVVMEQVQKENASVCNTLISMYSKCGSMQQARNIFQNMSQRDVVSWNALMLGYVKNGEALAGLELFSCMDCQPSRVTFIAAAKACVAIAALDRKAGLEYGIAIQKRARDLSFEKDAFVGSIFVEIYSKCRDMTKACRAFDEIKHRDVFSWNALILGYVENGENKNALNVFPSMDCPPNAVTFVASLKACGGLVKDKQLNKETCLRTGRMVHQKAEELGLEKDVVVASALINMYSKLGVMTDARRVFDGMKQRDVVSWTALIYGYVENGESRMALELFHSMDCSPNCFTVVAVVKACTDLASSNKADKESVHMGVAIHRLARELGFDSNVVVACTLINMYSDFGDMEEARRVFDRASHRDVALWNALAQGYVNNGQSLLALEVLEIMDCRPNLVTYIAALKACEDLATGDTAERHLGVQKGQMFHREAEELGFVRDLAVASTLVSMYSKFGDMVQAQVVFGRMRNHDVVSWTALITGYVDNEQFQAALDVFANMDCEPNRVTFIAALRACTRLASENRELSLQRGVIVHRRAKDLEKDIVVASILVEMYSKCGDMQRAREVFDGMSNRDVVSWTALIIGHMENGSEFAALEVFRSMDCPPDRVTLALALKACGGVGAMELGRRVHVQVCERGWEQDDMVATCLVTFYGKCGNMNSAELVFNRMHSRDLVSWTALIGGYSSIGDTSRVFVLVKSMLEFGHKQDSVTTLLILAACSHAGIVEEAERHFNALGRYGVTPTVKHYACLVDTLGRSNRLEDALSVVRGMPCPADSVIWMSLLGACRKWSNISIGKIAFDAVLRLADDDQSIGAAYVLMRNIYEKLDMQQEQQQIEDERKTRRWMRRGQAYWCDTQGGVHSSITGGSMELEVKEKLKALLYTNTEELLHRKRSR